MSLYNEVRPKTLSEVKGQNNLKAQLSGMFLSGNIPHGLLLVGPRGTGKTTVARIVARFINCENPADGEPCNGCPSCKSIFEGNNPDVVELDAASNNGVEDVHRITESAQFAPMGKSKVYILDEVHMFSNAAWNALLKLLEEPPSNVYFILCTTEEAKIPATIISRCCRLNFEKISLNVVVTAMMEICDKYGKAYDEDALKLIARASDGCMRDALSILESFFDTDSIVTDKVVSTLGLSEEDVIFTVLTGVQEGDAKKALDALSKASAKGVSLGKLTKGLIEAVIDAMYISQGAEIDNILNTDGYRKQLAAFAKDITSERCLELINRLSEAYSALSKTQDAQFLLETAVLTAINFESEIESLRKRVEKLENGQRFEGVSQPDTTVSESVLTNEEEPPVEMSDDFDTADGFTNAEGEDIPFAEDELPNFVDNESDSTPSSDTGNAADDVFAKLPAGTVVTAATNIFSFEEHKSATDKTDEKKNNVTDDDSEKQPDQTPFFTEGLDDLPPMDDDGLSGLLWQ